MTPVGGQAVLEGVMMRTPRYWAVSVRRPDGRITSSSHAATSVAARHRLLRLPVVRGVAALGDSLAIGFRALGLAARYASTDEDATEEEGEGELSTWSLVVAFTLAIGFALVLFKASPALLADFLGLQGVWFTLVEGGLRVAILVGYLALLSFIPDLRRVFEYHAAEHMAINALEAGDELTPSAVARHSRIHVRCGTAFLLWVMVVSIFVYLVVGKPDHWYWLVLSRFLMLLPIAGLAYEVIRLAGRYGSNPIVRAALAPGLWLQRLTTRPPSLDQLEVSIDALRVVLDLEASHGATPKVEVMA
jgi:uncharacterized protein YqhQ